MMPLGCSDVAGGASPLTEDPFPSRVGVRQPDPREEEPCDIQGGGQSYSSQSRQGRIEAVGTLTQRLRVTLSDNSVGVLHRCLGPGHTTPA